MSVYDYEVRLNNGALLPLSDFRDKVLLLVNTASECGFTKQYEGLQELHKKYADRGLVVIAFPSNQFGGQEPGSDAEIQEFCKTNYNVTFTVAAKIGVKGDDADPLFSHIMSVVGHEVPWNFTKFIVDNDEITVNSPDTEPADMDALIDHMLLKKANAVNSLNAESITDEQL
jgi:glutathione peroxidase